MVVWVCVLRDGPAQFDAVWILGPIAHKRTCFFETTWGDGKDGIESYERAAREGKRRER